MAFTVKLLYLKAAFSPVAFLASQTPHCPAAQAMPCEVSDPGKDLHPCRSALQPEICKGNWCPWQQWRSMQAAHQSQQYFKSLFPDTSHCPILCFLPHITVHSITSFNSSPLAAHGGVVVFLSARSLKEYLEGTAPISLPNQH